MELPGNGKWGRHKRRCMDAVRENKAVVEVAEEDTEVGTNGEGKSTELTPNGRSLKNKKILM